MNNPLTFFRTEGGEELVVITRAEYDRLSGDLAGDADENAIAGRIVRETSDAIARGEDVAIPESVWEAIEGGESPILAIRRWRDMTQLHLAHRTGLSQSYISQIEAGEKRPSVEVLRQLAKELRVPVDVLLGD
jgi:DNA-binding XRE family transcriptional regulator